MNAFTRGIRNAFRNSIRTGSIVIILGLSVGLVLTMLVARQAVQDKIETIKSSIGNTITVTPAGSQGMMGGGEPLKDEQLDPLANLAHVTSVSKRLSDRWNTDDTTNLKSAIEPGTLGKRQAGNSGVRVQGQGPVFMQKSPDGTVTQSFTMPIMVIGTNDVSGASTYGGDSVSFTAGKAFDPSSDENVAVVGKSLAEKNGLQVGSTFTAYGTSLTVVGIYDAGTDFANASAVLPLATLQRISNQADYVTSATITVNSLDNLAATVDSVEDKLGSAADITSSQDTAEETVAPLENVKSIAMFSLVGALIAGAVIILMTMLMIVRERRREIGVMKAIGASNLKVTFQFMSEAVTLTCLGLAVGLLLGLVTAGPVTSALVTTSANNAAAESVPGAGGPSPGKPMLTMRGPGGVAKLGDDSVENIRNIQASVGWEALGYGAAAALIIAIIGSALPAFFISKIRPAEVMRAE
jgi:putative ABC transport system permease protein